MTHIYTECSSTSITNLNTFNSKKKDQVGTVLIGLIGFLGLGYILFNPTFPNSNNFSGKRTDSKIYFSASSLNSEKTADALFNTTIQQPSSIDNQLAIDAKH